ncbi:MAG: DEAD/DEAH box helicase family protein [Celeribacter sp.]|jgi:superfamily II DNA or RNA helicase
MLNFTEPKEINLRPYQADAIENLRAGIRGGKRRLLLCAGTGAGKTLTAAHLLHEAARKGSYALFIVDRVALVDQTSSVFDEYGIQHGIVQGVNERWMPNENVQVCSAQTLAKRSLPRDPALIVVDEAHCFAPGTKVSTPHGDVNIESLTVGDQVMNAFGAGTVTNVFKHSTQKDIVRVIFDDGTEIECTADHRFFTGNSWVQARLLDGEGAVSIEGMPDLWGYLSTEDQPNREGELVGGARGVLAEASVLLAELLEEAEEPDAPEGLARENGQELAGDGLWSISPGRQREGLNQATGSSAGGAGGSMDRRTCSAHRAAQSWWSSFALQDRPRTSRGNDCPGSGWGVAQLGKDQGKGREEGRISFLKRVVSVQSVEREGLSDVFNIEVSGHPSYFANGVLVHNCQYKATLDYMARHPQAVKIGLTATPFTKGMGDHWDDVVNVIPTRRLIEDGFLIEPKIYIAKSPDDADLGLNSYGEFSDSSASTAGIQIVGDVVQEWMTKTTETFGGPVKTIVFSPTVDHGRELCAAFSAAGFNFQQISYLDRSDEERAEKIAEFRRPDSIIDGLVSCGVLTKGFDVPDVKCGISCKPYRKSLSSHMQEIGRVMRSHADKDAALWLDHSGNIERFGIDMFDVWDHGVGDLDHSTKRDSKPRERNEQVREKVVCPECSGALRGNLCMSCGWERPARSGVVNVAGEMVEFKPSDFKMQPRAGLRAECLSDPRKVWDAALDYTMAHTSKGEQHARKWAYGVFRGVYPSDKLPFGWFDAAPAAMVDPSASALVEREIKRFRKGSKRGAA